MTTKSTSLLLATAVILSTMIPAMAAKTASTPAPTKTSKISAPAKKCNKLKTQKVSKIVAPKKAK